MKGNHRTEKSRRQPIDELDGLYGIDYLGFCEATGYKASPAALLNSLRRGSVRTMRRVQEYKARKERANDH